MKDNAGIRLRRGAIEFLVIFVGVTLSLVADDWRQEQEELRIEMVALQDMMEDLRADSAVMALVLRRSAIWDRNALWLLRNTDRATAPTDTIEMALTGLGFTARHELVRAAYEGLKSSGDLNLIRDPVLRREITLYYEVQQPGYERYAERGMTDHYFRLADGTVGITEWVVSDDAESLRDPSGRVRLLHPWSQIARNDAFRDGLMRVGTWAGSMLNRHAQVAATNTNLRELIRNYLGNVDPDST